MTTHHTHDMPTMKYELFLIHNGLELSIECIIPYDSYMRYISQPFLRSNFNDSFINLRRK